TLAQPGGLDQVLLRKDVMGVRRLATSLMPSFAQALRPSDLADLLAWLRGHLGTGAPNVNGGDVSPRAQTKPALVDFPKLGIFEQAFTQLGSDANPYVEVTANATFVQPDGHPRSIPLFWDGGAKWKVRFSPDVIGAWSWSVSSNDPGLNGANGSFNCVSSTNRGGI